MKKLGLLILSSLFSFSTLSAQLFPGNGITVRENGIELPNPWLGGLDLPQFSGADINQDGREDLLIFDKKGNKTLVLLKDENGEYRHAPNFEPFFPEMIQFALFRDYNCDGLVDIFSFNAAINAPPPNGEGQGIVVFKQKIVNGEIVFEEAVPFIESTFDQSGFLINLYLVAGDIPGIEDFDGDGDLDIVVFYLIGTSMPLYRNLSVESGYGCDSLIFETYSSCWGEFSESTSNNLINFDISCKGGPVGQPIPSNGPKHAGSSILAFDQNEDGKMDLLLGDVSYNTMVYLQNDASSLNAHMDSNTVDYSFPSYDTPANVEIFPAAYYVDVTNDGKKDLLVAPNSLTSHLNVNSSWLYENTGNPNDRFNFVQNDFLIDGTIDLGSYSYPFFFDHNGDGLQDLFVANGYIYNFLGNTIGTIYYYENVGSDTLPEFNLVSDDYMGWRSLGLDFMRPTFGDLDNDGDLDMVLGDANGLLHYFENEPIGANASFQAPQLQYFNIDIGNKAHPQLVDVNQDGLLDLLIGREGSYGHIAYYWNYGTPEVPMFSADSMNNTFGNIETSVTGFINGNSSPFLYERNGEVKIYVGSELGIISSYELNPDSLKSGSFELADAFLLPVRVGSRSTIQIIDINGDNGLDYFIGNARGGVSFYSEVGTDTTVIGIRENLSSNSFSFDLYPNPSSKLLNLEFSGEKDSYYTIDCIDILGRHILRTSSDKNTLQIDVSNFENGVYYLKVSQNNSKTAVKSFIKH